MNNYNYNDFTPATRDSNSNLTTPYEGFIRGNLFNDLYEPYKDYKPTRLEPANEQAELLLAIDEYGFATHDLVLSLDVNPDDQQKIELFNNYSNAFREALNEYEQKYGPITLNSDYIKSTWSWREQNWPWDEGA